jgi:hypothetical protein
MAPWCAIGAFRFRNSSYTELFSKPLCAASYDQRHIVGLPTAARLLHFGDNIIQDFDSRLSTMLLSRRN